MKNITLAIDASTLNKARRMAAQQGTSLNGLIRNYLQRLCGNDGDNENGGWMDELFKEVDRVVKAKKITWTRDELHRF